LTILTALPLVQMTSLKGFDLGAAIDVGDGVRVWVRRPGKPASLGAGQLASSEQPASLSGSMTVLPGLRILAVSAMKCTPQKTMTSAFGFGRLPGKSQGIADVIGQVLDFRDLVVMGQDDGVQPVLERENVAGKGVQPFRRQRGAGYEIRIPPGISHVNHIINSILQLPGQSGASFRVASPSS
jgi:hypothetical protein